jgi:hypothetical protein
MSRSLPDLLTPEELNSFPLYREFPNGRKIIFIHINKTGGTSLRQALGLPPEEHWRGRFRKHYYYREVINFLPADVLDQATIATFVRNPWDRLVSLYCYRKWRASNEGFKKLPRLVYASFTSWMQYHLETEGFRQRNLQPQLSWLCDEEGQESVDFIGKFENLAQDAHRLCDLLGISPPVLPHLIKSTRNLNYRSYYTPELSEQVSHLYRADIERFDYSF